MSFSTARKQIPHSVDDRLPTPLYHQIYLILRSQILDGTYRAEDLVPGEQEVARLYGVSRITAKRALDELAAAGLAVRERGRGTRVIGGLPAMRPVTASVEGLLENLLVMGLETKVRLLDFAYVGASEEIATALACEPNDAVQRAVRVRSLNGVPFSHLTTFVPADIGRSYAANELASMPLLVLLERYGVVVTSADQTISAALADAVTAPVLDVDVGSPLLSIRRVVYAQAERPVEFIKALYRPDLYQHRMSLTRVRGETAHHWSPTEPGDQSNRSTTG